MEAPWDGSLPVPVREIRDQLRLQEISETFHIFRVGVRDGKIHDSNLDGGSRNGVGITKHSINIATAVRRIKRGVSGRTSENLLSSL
jgi:hypothetical protein